MLEEKRDLKREQEDRRRSAEYLLSLFENFGDMMAELVDGRVDTEEVQLELDTALKAKQQVEGLQKKIEGEMDSLDVTDRHYDRKYESLSRRLGAAFDAIDEAEQKVSDCEARIESIRQQSLPKESINESLRLFDKMYDKMTDFEKKSFVRTFIDSIELYPDKKRKNGNPIKMMHFKFPVSYNGGIALFEVKIVQYLIRLHKNLVSSLLQSFFQAFYFSLLLRCFLLQSYDLCI